MGIKKAAQGTLLSIVAVALACALAPVAFAAQGEASLSTASVITAQGDDQDISDAKVTAGDQTYTGAALQPAVKVVLDDMVLTLNKDYTVAYSSNVNAGTATITVTGKGDFTGKATGSFKINPAAASGMDVASVSDKTYSGEAFKPTPKVTYKGKVLKNDTDYTLSYDSNKNAGKAKVIVTGKGNFTGAKTTTFKIVKAEMDKVKIEAISDKTYTGKEITVNVKATYKGKKVKQGSDFTTKYKKNVNVGTAEVILVGTDNFKGKKSKNFKIEPAAIKKADMADIAARTYTGSAIQPAPSLKFNGTQLKSGTDYTVSYKANTNAGTAKVIVSGKKNFTGTKKGTFTINPATMSSVSIAAIPSQGYTGAALTPNPSITYKGKTLKKDTDYTLSYRNNVNRGTASVSITGKGNFTGVRSASFAIVQASLEKAKIAKIGKQKYTGAPITPALTVTYAGKTLVKDRDYQVVYRNNTEKGKATATITGINNYTGTKSKNFTIG